MSPSWRNPESGFFGWAHEHATSRWALLATTIALSFVIQVLFFVVYFRGKVPPAGDTGLYTGLAQALVDGDGFSRDRVPTAVVPPLYPLALAPFFALDVEGGPTLAVFGMLMGAISAGLIALIAQRAFGETEGWVAGLLAAGLPSIAFWSPYVLTDTLSLLLLAGAVLVLVQPSGVSVRAAAAGGALLGAGLLTRPAVGFLAIALLVWLCGRRVQGRRFVTTAAAVVALLLVLLPWTLRNQLKLGRPYVLTSYSGANMWTAVHWLPGPKAEFGDDIPPLPRVPGASEAENDDLQRERAIEVLRANPERYLRGLYQKPRFMWPLWVPGFSAVRSLSEVWPTILGVLAVAGFAIRPEMRRGGTWWLWLMGSLTVSVMVLYIDADLRYRLPLAVAVVPAAGAALVAFVRRPPGRLAPAR